MRVEAQRRKVVLVVGDGQQNHERKSASVGEWIAASEWHLITGGGAGVMRSVSRAFHDFQRRSLAIGIVPGTVERSDGRRTWHPKNENYPNSWVDVAILTHLPGEDPEGDSSRNHINVLSADLVIALPGGRGTLAEVRLAREYGKPVVAYLSDGESIHDQSIGKLCSDGVVVVHNFRDLVNAGRAILAPDAEVRRKTFRIPLSTCVLRLWDWSDAESLQRHANNRRVWRNMLDQFPYPYTARDAENWLSGQSAATVFAIDVDGQAVGGIGLTSRPEDAASTNEVGYWLGEEFWNRGIATESVCAITGYAFASNSDLHRISARVFPWNQASMRVLEKAGYRREGVLRHSAIKEGRFVDEVIFGRIRQGKS
jgi:uncharacterized protein (TIGR00725 family)